MQVHAIDEDKGVNGQVKYSIVQQPNQKGTKFTVDEETGEVSTNKVFDREGDDGKFVSVTVKATDQGEPSLEGVCSFTVEITDVNDNPPLFDRQVCRPFEGHNFLCCPIGHQVDLLAMLITFPIVL